VGHHWWFFTGLAGRDRTRENDKTHRALISKWRRVTQVEYKFLTSYKLRTHALCETTAISHKNKVHLLSSWVRLSAIPNNSSLSSSVACGLSSLDRVTLRSPGPEPTWSSAPESWTTIDTSPLPQADLRKRKGYSASVTQRWLHFLIHGSYSVSLQRMFWCWLCSFTETTEF